MERTRDYRRKKNYSKAVKRKKFCENAYGFDWYEHLGQYIKGKIHHSQVGFFQEYKTSSTFKIQCSSS